MDSSQQAKGRPFTTVATPAVLAGAAQIKQILLNLCSNAAHAVATVERPGVASCHITEELRAKAPAAGVRELIYKPNTVDELCEAVARYANAQSADAISS